MNLICYVILWCWDFWNSLDSNSVSGYAFWILKSWGSYGVGKISLMGFYEVVAFWEERWGSKTSNVEILMFAKWCVFMGMMRNTGFSNVAAKNPGCDFGQKKKDLFSWGFMHCLKAWVLLEICRVWLCIALLWIWKKIGAFSQIMIDTVSIPSLRKEKNLK